MKTLQEVMTAFETAELNAGLSRNTRNSYGPIIADPHKSDSSKISPP
jgi:hypothetical protein